MTKDPQDITDYIEAAHRSLMALQQLSEEVKKLPVRHPIRIAYERYLQAAGDWLELQLRVQSQV